MQKYFLIGFIGIMVCCSPDKGDYDQAIQTYDSAIALYDAAVPLMNELIADDSVLQKELAILAAGKQDSGRIKTLEQRRQSILEIEQSYREWLHALKIVPGSEMGELQNPTATPAPSENFSTLLQIQQKQLAEIRKIHETLKSLQKQP